VVAVDLADGGVHIDGHRLLPRPGARRPRPGKELLGGPIELADVPEGEGAQERPQRAGRHHPVAQHRRGRAGAQHSSVVDAVAAGHQRMHQGQHLTARTMRAGAVAQVDQPVDHRLHPQPLGQGGG
jgi:hypothetical protein